MALRHATERRYYFLLDRAVQSDVDNLEARQPYYYMHSRDLSANGFHTNRGRGSNNPANGGQGDETRAVLQIADRTRIDGWSA